MKLFLVRHGAALPYTADPNEPLSEQGRAQASDMGARLVAKGFRPREIWHSAKTRARETAALMAAASGNGVVVRIVEGLSPGDSPVPVITQLEGGEHDLMLVSHLPLLPRIAAGLLGAGASARLMSFPTAGVLVVQRTAPGTWSLVDQLWPY